MAENIKSRKTKNKNSTIKIGLIGLLLIVGILIYGLRGCDNNEITSLYNIDTGINYEIMNYEDSILALNYEGARIISENGEEVATLENRMSNPRAIINREYILLYDRGSNTVTLYKDMKKRYSYQSETSVKIAKVNKNGHVLMVCQEVGYNCGIYVLTPKGEIEYIWKIGDVNVVDADLSPDNKKIAVASINTETGVIEENIIFADVSKEEELSRIVTKGSMPLYVKYTDSGSAVVVSDNKLCGYSVGGEERWKNEFQNRLLNSFEVDNKGNTVLALRGIKNNTIVEIYNKNGSKSGEYLTDTEIKAMSVKDKYIALCEQNSVSVLSYSGKLTDKCVTQKEYKDVIIINHGGVILAGEQGIESLEM